MICVVLQSGAGDGVSPQSPLPLGGCGSERPGHVPKEPWLGAEGEDRERMEEKENNNKRPTGRAGSDGGGGGLDAGGANERMVGPQTDRMVKEFNLRQVSFKNKPPKQTQLRNVPLNMALSSKATTMHWHGSSLLRLIGFFFWLQYSL